MDSTIVDVFCQSLYASNTAATTIKTYRNTILRLAVFLVERGSDLLLATESDIEQWMISLKTKSHLENISIRSYLVAIKQFYKWSERKRLVDRSPAQYLKFGARLRSVKIPELQTVMDLLFAAPAPTPLSVRDRALSLLIVNSGCRISEACNMLLEDIDLQSGEFRVIGKGDKERICLLSGEPLEATAEYIENWRPQLAPCSGYVWITQYGEPMSTKAYRRTLETRVAHAALPKHVFPSGRTRSAITPHKLRHLFATTIYRNGADLMAIRDLLGHESLATTQIYTHSDNGHLRKAHALFPARWTPPPTNPQSEAVSGGACPGVATTIGRSNDTRSPRPLTLQKNTIPFRRSA